MITWITHGVFAGAESAISEKFLREMKISIIVNLTTMKKTDLLKNAGGLDIECFNYLLPNQELMDTEIPKTVTKLNSIVDDIKELVSLGNTVLIVCADGKEKCMLVAAHLLITQGGNFNDVFTKLSQTHYTDADRADAIKWKSAATMPEEERAVEYKKFLARKQITCLSMRSHQKLLREYSGKK